MTLEWRLCRKISMNSDPNIPALLISLPDAGDQPACVTSARASSSSRATFWCPLIFFGAFLVSPSTSACFFGVHPSQLYFSVHLSQLLWCPSIWALLGVQLSFFWCPAELSLVPLLAHPSCAVSGCLHSCSLLALLLHVLAAICSQQLLWPDYLLFLYGVESHFFLLFSPFVPFVTLAWTHTQLWPDKGDDRNAGESAGFKWGTDPFSLTGDTWVLTSAPSAGNLWILKTQQNTEFYWTWIFSVRACCLTVHHPAPSMVLVPLLLILLMSNLIIKASIIFYFFCCYCFSITALALLVVCSSFLTAFPKTFKCSTAFKKWSVIKSEHYWVTST